MNTRSFDFYTCTKIICTDNHLKQKYRIKRKSLLTFAHGCNSFSKGFS